MQDGVVIAGGGLAAARVGGELRHAGYTGPVTIVGAEARLPYDRPPLTKELLRGDIDDTTLKPREFYDQQQITLRLGSTARSVDPAARMLTLADHTVLGYDHLVIATGLVPRRIPALADRPDVRVVRSVDDALELRRRASTAKRALVIGAGFIGCEVTASLRSLGVHVVLVEPQQAPLTAALGEQIGALVARMHRAAGVDVRTGIGVMGTRESAVVLSDGTEVTADLVVLGIGATPVTGWLAGSGIELDEADDGVVCDASGRTTVPGVWAIGDVASWRGGVGRRGRVEHWSNVVAQAQVLASAMVGREPPAGPVVPYFWSDQYDVKIQCLGEPRAGDAVHLVEDDGHRFLAYYERDGALVGAVGADMRGKVMSVRAKIAAGAAISEVLP